MIRKDTHIPTSTSKNELQNELRGLAPGECLILSGEIDKRKIYLAASRERKRIQTAKTSVGVRVWLNPKYHPAEMGGDDVPTFAAGEIMDARRSKIDALKDLQAGILERDQRREIAREIDRQAAPKDEFSGPQVVEAEWIP